VAARAINSWAEISGQTHCTSELNSLFIMLALARR
jgi:hypothetical protein